MTRKRLPKLARVSKRLIGPHLELAQLEISLSRRMLWIKKETSLKIMKSYKGFGPKSKSKSQVERKKEKAPPYNTSSK